MTDTDPMSPTKKLYKLNGMSPKQRLGTTTTITYWVMYGLVGMWVQLIHISARRTAWLVRRNPSLLAVFVWPARFAGYLLAGTAAQRRARLGFFLRSRLYSPEALIYLKRGYFADRTSLPADYNNIRQQVRQRDGHTCQVCSAVGGRRGDVELHVDHVVPRRWGGTNDPRNLRTLCKSCHGARHIKVFD